MENLNEIVESVPETIDTIFKNIYRIPVFQRPYKWGKDEIGEFISDLENAEYQNKHWYVGTLHIKPKKKVNSSLYEYDIIDGQQRITTVALILMALLTIISKQGNSNSDSIKDIKDKLFKDNFYLIENEGIEKNIVRYVFENSCNDPFSLCENLEIYHIKNKIEKDFKNNFEFIYLKINELQEKIGSETLYKFIKEKMFFITITVNLPSKEMFEIFDSINSKGKALDEIDKIKSYIFRNLDEKDYDTYLQKWGELIERTEDNLEEYVYIFIKAYIKYYKSTGMKYFKAFCNNELKKYYNDDKLSEALKNLIDDLYKYVDVFMNMKNSKLPYQNHRAEFYMKAINHLKYVHPLPLLFRTLCENKYNKLEKDKANKLIKESFVFMFNFQTLNERDSKETQEFFSKLMVQLYNSPLDVDSVVKLFRKALRDRGISKKTLERKITEHIAFVDKATRESYILLMFYEFSDEKGRIDYDKTIWMLEHKDIMQVDHILPLTPEKNSVFKYEKVLIDGEEHLNLLPGNDFVKNSRVYNTMDYDDFRREILDKIGNLQICWRKDNVNKSNKFVKLTDYSNYSTYKQVRIRTNNMIKKLSSTELFDI